MLLAEGAWKCWEEPLLLVFLAVRRQCDVPEGFLEVVRLGLRYEPCCSQASAWGTSKAGSRPCEKEVLLQEFKVFFLSVREYTAKYISKKCQDILTRF